jgi:hypothetical protein
MTASIKGSLNFILVLTMFLSSLNTLSARSTATSVRHLTPQNQPTEIKINDWKLLDAGEVSQRIEEFRKGKAGATLDAFLRKKGYSPGDGQEAFFGVDIFFKGGDGKEAKTSIVLQDYVSYSVSSGGDRAAIAFATASSGDQSSTYSFGLFGDGKTGLEKATEFYVNDQFNVVPAHSWWTCFLGNLNTRCVGRCRAIASCFSAPTFSQFLRCLTNIGICAGSQTLCALGAMACCTCNCNWWCSWACGCCHS